MNARHFKGMSRNPAIQEMADRFFTVARLSIGRAALAINHERDAVIPEEGIERLAWDFLTTYQEAHPKAISQLVEHLREERYGDQVDFAFKETVAEQLLASGFFNELWLPAELFRLPDPDKDPEGWTDRVIDVIEPGETVKGPGKEPPAAPAPKPRELRLKLARLDCVTMVPWEIADMGTAGNAMVAGGIGEDSTGQKVAGPEFFVNEFRKDGERFDIRPDYTLLMFSLSGSGPWPRSYVAVVSLAERDNGGFHDFLQRLWDSIGKDVILIVTSLALAELGLEAGAAAGSAIAPVIGTVVGAVIGATIGLVVGWAIDTFADDILASGANPLGVPLPAQDAQFDGKATTAIDVIDFTHDRGRYLLSYYWELA